eukprot:CAMPEP_0179135692 /NCGR_PEP_ID=MMETSP0796-20121207/64620_1 /TAXON_ID=73915 /ORGANISM="Pyrodinium bahamense, Strain pbaha01" /LENGTH=562 /DNA_ID=CAMNT_0020834729 /DNA_START=31 /DNA_END=1719 /DNA_ORIENTATION=+
MARRMVEPAAAEACVTFPPISARCAVPATNSPRALAATSAQRWPAVVAHGPQAAPAPLWLSMANWDEAVAPVRSILDVVPPRLGQDRYVREVAALEDEADACGRAGSYVEAAEQREQALDLRRRLLGDAHRETHAAFEAYVGLCNGWGLRYVRTGQWTAALVLLKKAEAMTEAGVANGIARRVLLRTVTFTNLMCYFRARGKLHAAMQYAEKALALVERHGEHTRLALLELNYAVLLSTAARHEDALDRLDRALAALELQEREAAQPEHGPGGVELGGKQMQQRCLSQEVPTMLVVTHHNIWAALQQLGRVKDAADSLRRAVHTARVRLGATHFLTAKVEQALVQVQGQLRIAAAPMRRQAGSAAPPLTLLTELPPVELRVTARKGLLPVAFRMAASPPAGEPPPQRGPRPGRRLPGCGGRAGPALEARPRMQGTSGCYVGSPIVQQQVYGGQPLSTLERAQQSKQARAQRPGTTGAQDAREGVGTQDTCQAEPGRLHAIGLLRGQLQEHRERDEVEAQAATRIQAAFRGHWARGAGIDRRAPAPAAAAVATGDNVEAVPGD